MDGAGKTGAEEAQPPEGKGAREHSRQEEEEETAGAPQGLFRGGKRGEPAQEEEERLSEEWENAKRWSKMDRLAKELTAEKRLQGEEEEEEEDPDRSMKLSFRAPAYGFRGPGLQLRRGWRPSSREDSVEAGLPLQVRSYLEEKKEEEGSANRRPEVGTGWEPALGQAPGVGPQPGGSCTAEGTLSPWSLGLERCSDKALSGAWEGTGERACQAGRRVNPSTRGPPSRAGGQADGDRSVRIRAQQPQSW